MIGEPMEHPIQERDRMRGGPAVAVMVVSVAVIVAGVASAWWLLRSELARSGARDGGIGRTLGPPPAERERLPRRLGGLLQTQVEQGEGGRSREEAAARRRNEPPDRWGWIDRERGVARMPIDRAMDLVLERYAAEPLERPSPARALGGAEGSAGAGEPVPEAGEPVPVEVGPPSLDEPPGGRE